MQQNELHLLYLCKVGSHAHGTSTPESDLDFKGFGLAHPKYYTGFAYHFDQIEQLVSKGYPHDLTIYDLKKYFRLAADCNPNIIEVLFCDPGDVVYRSPLSEPILRNRDLFLSKKAKFTFSGYAIAQLKRIEVHRKWLLHPPTHKPERSEFGLPERKLISSDNIGACYKILSDLLTDVFHKEIEKGKIDLTMQDIAELNICGLLQSKGAPADALALLDVSENFQAALQKEQEYIKAIREWGQYQNWKATRNPKRAELERKYFLDVKHAFHLVRLMRMGIEILRDHVVLVKRPDAEELLAIRNGAWSYERIVEFAKEHEQILEDLYMTSTLPKTPDIEILNEICSEIIEAGDRINWAENNWKYDVAGAIKYTKMVDYQKCCREYHLQMCQCCNDYTCGDNTNPNLLL